MKRALLVSASACVLAALQSQAAFAQAAAPAAANELGAVIVTAQRVSEDSQRAPISIDVVKPEDIIRAGVSRPEQLSELVPSLVANNSGGANTTYFIRGVGNFTVNAYSDPAIAFNYDGVYVGRPTSTSGMFYDLQRIEVLNGPQGTLYGRNATGGAINVLPNRPQLGRNTADASVSYGNYDTINTQGTINVGWSDQLAMRLSGTYAKHQGYMSDGTSDLNDFGLRFQILYKPTDALSIRLSTDYAHQGGLGTGAYYQGATSFNGTGYTFTPAPAAIDRTVGLHDPRSEAYRSTIFIGQVGRTAEPLNTLPFNDNSYQGYHAEITWQTDAGTLTVLPALRYAHIDDSFTSPAFRGAQTDEHDAQHSLEARWNGKLADGKLDYILGGYYFKESINASAQFPQEILSPYQTFKTATRSWAGFARATYHVTDAIRLTAGGRYTDDSKVFNGVSDTYLLFCGNPAPPQDFCPTLPLQPRFNNGADLVAFYAARGIRTSTVPAYVLPGFVAGTPNMLNAQIPINSGQDSTKFTYRVAGEWDVAPRSMVYASYETGYRGGGFSFARGLESYQPETIKAFTVGSKNRFLDNRLQVNLEGFYWKYRNQQVSQFGFDRGNPPATVFVTQNIGNSTIKGANLDVQFLVARNTLLTGNVQYLDSTYDSYIYFTPNTGLPPNTACSFAPTTQNGGLSEWRVNCSGRQGFNAPKWSFTAGIQQTIPLDRYKLVLNAGTRYRGDTFVAGDYTPWLTSKADFQSNASVTFSPSADGWYLSAFINNIENNRRIQTASTGGSTGIVTATVSAPRTYGLRIGAKFE